ncbi:hypothetical protein DIPPA_10659 [Diplonema papillatum]|nr:hypothetical protein DIPPA_10659 [Diplonema papillatum]
MRGVGCGVVAALLCFSGAAASLVAGEPCPEAPALRCTGGQVLARPMRDVTPGGTDLFLTAATVATRTFTLETPLGGGPLPAGPACDAAAACEGPPSVSTCGNGTVCIDECCKPSCSDDIHGALAGYDLQCSEVVEALGCDTRLAFIPRHAANPKVRDICPVACGACAGFHPLCEERPCVEDPLDFGAGEVCTAYAAENTCEVQARVRNCGADGVQVQLDPAADVGCSSLMFTGVVDRVLNAFSDRPGISLARVDMACHDTSLPRWLTSCDTVRDVEAFTTTLEDRFAQFDGRARGGPRAFPTKVGTSVAAPTDISAGMFVRVTYTAKPFYTVESITVLTPLVYPARGAAVKRAIATVARVFEAHYDPRDPRYYVVVWCTDGNGYNFSSAAAVRELVDGRTRPLRLENAVNMTVVVDYTGDQLPIPELAPAVAGTFGGELVDQAKAECPPRQLFCAGAMQCVNVTEPCPSVSVLCPADNATLFVDGRCVGVDGAERAVDVWGTLDWFAEAAGCAGDAACPEGAATFEFSIDGRVLAMTRDTAAAYSVMGVSNPQQRRFLKRALGNRVRAVVNRTVAESVWLLDESSAGACQDDANGTVARHQLDCPMLLAAGCDADVRTVVPAEKPGTIRSLCPKSCGECGGAGGAARSPCDDVSGFDACLRAVEASGPASCDVGDVASMPVCRPFAFCGTLKPRVDKLCAVHDREDGVDGGYEGKQCNATKCWCVNQASGEYRKGSAVDVGRSPELLCGTKQKVWVQLCSSVSTMVDVFALGFGDGSSTSSASSSGPYDPAGSGPAGSGPVGPKLPGSSDLVPLRRGQSAESTETGVPIKATAAAEGLSASFDVRCAENECGVREEDGSFSCKPRLAIGTVVQTPHAVGIAQRKVLIVHTSSPTHPEIDRANTAYYVALSVGIELNSVSGEWIANSSLKIDVALKTEYAGPKTKKTAFFASDETVLNAATAAQAAVVDRIVDEFVNGTALLWLGAVESWEVTTVAEVTRLLDSQRELPTGVHYADFGAHGRIVFDEGVGSTNVFVELVGFRTPISWMVHEALAQELAVNPDGTYECPPADDAAFDPEGIGHSVLCNVNNPLARHICRQGDLTALSGYLYPATTFLLAPISFVGHTSSRGRVLVLGTDPPLCAPILPTGRGDKLKAVFSVPNGPTGSVMLSQDDADWGTRIFSDLKDGLPGNAPYSLQIVDGSSTNCETLGEVYNPYQAPANGSCRGVDMYDATVCRVGDISAKLGAFLFGKSNLKTDPILNTSAIHAASPVPELSIVIKTNTYTVCAPLTVITLTEPRNEYLSPTFWILVVASLLVGLAIALLIGIKCGDYEYVGGRVHDISHAVNLDEIDKGFDTHDEEMFETDGQHFEGTAT